MADGMRTALKIACGIRDAGVTSLTAELGRRVSVAEALALCEVRLAKVLGTANTTHRRLDTLLG